MTDKVQKIREVIEKRYECWREKESKSHSIESEIRMSECKHLLLMLDSLQKEPVSEELEEAARSYSDNLDNICGSIGEQVRNSFKAGAKWQEKQDQSTIELAEDHAMLSCMEKMKEEMFAKAIDGVIAIDYYGDDDKTYGFIAHNSFCLEDMDLKDMDKVKIILIKED